MRREGRVSPARAAAEPDARREGAISAPAPERGAVSPGEERRGRRFSIRAVLVAFALIPLNSLWIVHTEIVRYAGHPTTTSLFFNVVFSLAVVILVNALVRRVRPGWAFSQAELLIVYTLLSLGSAMVGHDLYQVLIAGLTHPFWYATESNKWESLFFRYLPRWLMVDDHAALRGYFLGN